MTTQLFKNNAASTLATPVTVGGTSISLQVGHGSRFPTPTGSDYFLVTLFEKDGSGNEFNYEIVKVTARSGDVFTTISRDYEGTVGVGGGSAYPSAVGANPSGVTYVQLRHTAYAAGNNLAKDGNLAGIANMATARTNLGLGSAALSASGDFAPIAHVGAGGTAHSDAVSAGAAGFMSGADKAKLDGIAAGATNYSHPINHPPSIITQDATNRFVTDAEKTAWDAKVSDISVPTHAATSKTTPVDADEIPLADSAASFGLKKLTWGNLKAASGSTAIAYSIIFGA